MHGEKKCNGNHKIKELNINASIKISNNYHFSVALINSSFTVTGFNTL